MSADAERLELEARGILSLPGLVPGNVVRRAREAVWAELERLKIRAAGKWHLRQLDGVPSFQIAARIARDLRPLAVFDELFPDALRARVDALAGTRLVAGQAHASLLVTPPQKELWSIPHHGWHVDVAAVDARLPGIQAFVLVDDVAPRGGGTMALAGSHRLRGSAQRALREDAFFRRLFDPSAAGRDELLREHALGGAPLQVVEMCGRAGDVFVMDMRVLHSPSTNGSTRPRMSATVRFLRP